MAIRKKLGEYLVQAGVLTSKQLEEALQIRQGTHKRLGEVLVEVGYASEDAIAKALAQQFGCEYRDLSQPDALAVKDFDLLPRELIKKYQIIPLEQTNGKLRILAHDPMDLELQDVLRFRMNVRDIELVIGAKSRISDYINLQFQETQEMIQDQVRQMSMDRGMSLDRGLSLDRGFSMDRGMSMDRGTSMDRGMSMDRGISIDRGMSIDRSGASMDRGLSIDRKPGSGGGQQVTGEAAVIRLVNQLIANAVRQGASDLHIEPMANHIRVRYRIDGVCNAKQNLPKNMQGPVITRIKIMSGMKIDERRVPQDGRIKLPIDGTIIDFRVSACPTYHGESVVMRVLRPDSVKIGLVNLGFEADTLDKFNKSIRRPNGIFLVTGPTGSGKTTTLYSALDILNRPDRKIITAEDPVEYNFPGINQCQVREDIGLSFATVLRSMLRQAPNIILVGEIRDKEVAEVAIQAALTGHLVFSTLHTNDAPSAITRLIDMGVKPFLVASSVQAVLGQRLIRKLCKECKQPDPNPLYLKLIGVKPADLENHTIYKPVGCGACNKSGYKGRCGIYEYMTMNSEIREMAFKRASSTQIRAAAITTGMRTLADDGRAKVLAGTTTPEEVAKMAQVGGVVEMEEEVHDFAASS
jgi:type IV pilus assembly protein PilB